MEQEEKLVAGGSGACTNGDGAGCYSGAGATGTSYSGGPGGGGTDHNSGYTQYGSDGNENGGRGGLGIGHRYSTSWAYRYAGGGAGNPGGFSGGSDVYHGEGNITTVKGEDGTGGLLIIFANTIENTSTGKIESNGSKGCEYGRAAGGSSGGGSINIFYLNEITQNGEIIAKGGEKIGNGSKGGDGCITIGTFVDGNFDNHTLLTGKRDLYAIVRDSGKTMIDYGISYTRSGRNDWDGMDDLYHFGQGSSSGVNNNTFTLTINYSELSPCLGTFSGIYAKFYEDVATSDWSDTSWMYSKIVVNYKDGTNSTEQTPTIVGNHSSQIEEPELTVNFEKNKEIDTIQIIICGLDGDDGHCAGWIQNMDLIP